MYKIITIILYYPLLILAPNMTAVITFLELIAPLAMTVFHWTVFESPPFSGGTLPHSSAG